MRARIPDPEWFAYVRAGDVFRVGGDFRVARIVNRKSKTGRLSSIDFAIRRRSWTNRPYTCLVANDFKGRGSASHFQYIGVRVRLTGPIDAELRRECLGRANAPRVIFAVDVRGVP